MALITIKSNESLFYDINICIYQLIDTCHDEYIVRIERSFHVHIYRHVLMSFRLEDPRFLNAEIPLHPDNKD